MNDEKLTCPYCKYTSDICNFPDLFYADDDNTDGLNSQFELLLELNSVGYNIVTCGRCGDVFIQKFENCRR